MAVSQHAIHAGESIRAPIWARPQASECPQASESIPVQNGIGCRAGKSIIQMLLQQHQVVFSSLVSYNSCFINVVLILKLKLPEILS